MIKNMFFYIIGILEMFVSITILFFGVKNGLLKFSDTLITYLLWLILNLLSVYTIKKYKSFVLALLIIFLMVPLSLIGLKVWGFLLAPDLAISMAILYNAIIFIFHKYVFIEKTK